MYTQLGILCGTLHLDLYTYLKSKLKLHHEKGSFHSISFAGTIVQYVPTTNNPET